MWGILRLSQNYTTYFQYKVVVNSNLTGRTSKSTSLDPIVVRGKASGFYILQQKYLSDVETIEINVDSKNISQSPNKEDLFFIKSSDIKDKIHEVLDDQISIESANFDSLFFYFHRQSNKKVPIIASVNLRYAKEYMPFTDIQLKPDSIFIYGQTKIISSIDSVTTQEISGIKLKKSINGLVGLKAIDGVSFSKHEIYYSQEIGRYYEKSYSLPLNIINSPHTKILISPKEVRVYYRALVIDKKGYKASDFSVQIDYNQILTTQDGKNMLRVEIVKYPKNVRAIRVDPLFVEML